MKRAVFIFGIFLFLILNFSKITLFAHGLVYDIKMAKTLIIKVAYNDGEPMSYSDVKIFSPDSTKEEYQNVTTDKNGQFAFVPDISGEWKSLINDGMGHALSKKVVVKEGMEIESHQHHGLEHWQKLIIAISIAWGLIGTALYFRRDKVK